MSAARIGSARRSAASARFGSLPSGWGAAAPGVCAVTPPNDDPVDVWAQIVEDPEEARLYKSQRGKGGFVRASWPEAVEMVAAAHVYTIKR